MKRPERPNLKHSEQLQFVLFLCFLPLRWVVTAGLTKDGEWVRLYPIDYRYLDSSKQFRKYQWIEVELGPRNNEKDKRLESRRPKIESISLFGEPISTKNNWSERKHVTTQRNGKKHKKARTITIVSRTVTAQSALGSVIQVFS